MYGTTDQQCWAGPGGGFDAYTSSDLEHWEGPFPAFRPTTTFWGTENFWAPEVHRYADRYYMLATFKAPGRCRGTHILVADEPLGPFLPLTEMPITPSHWECLDGTLYIENGVPWIVFCHEWLQAIDGRVVAMPLSSDLQRVVGPATVLFAASSAPWVRAIPHEEGRQDGHYVTDGPFLFRADGELMMLWSSFSDHGYALGLARSANGVLGPWIHVPEPVFDGNGGHAMIFRRFDGQHMLALHQPNRPPDERAMFLDVHLANVTLGEVAA
jgi:GH43 family beta-xylosidase